MALSAGNKLGPYEIVEAIGQGGMGAVYRARDTRLGRDVAIKVSDQKFSERFEREARVISSLNHPNICTLFDVGPNYLVMELVEGETLAHRIKQGAIPLDESLTIARQIADALEAAHEKGIVHRDLKPGNVMIKDDGPSGSTVKVLDFGLAKVAPTAQSASDGDHPELSPTLSMAATQAGVILGTAAYMSPEQARGKPVDKRADIWAFGVVLYEMVTGKKLFAGEDLTDTLASVVKVNPDLSGAPQQLHHVFTKCLEKDPRRRLRDIGDVWELLESDSAAVGVVQTSPARSALPWGVAGTLAVVAAIAVWAPWHAVQQNQDTALVRLNLDLDYYDNSAGLGDFALSPDGKRVAFVTDATGTPMLATRLLEEADATILPGTEGARIPFFSPDSQWIGFGQDGQVKKISVQGGPPIDLAPSPVFLGGSWGEDGFITGVLNAAVGLSRFPDTGGEPDPFVSLNGARAHRFPQALNGGATILFGAGAPIMEIQAVTLATGDVKSLIAGAIFGRYLPTGGDGATGHLVYLNQGTLFAVPFDLPSLEARGDPVPVLNDLATVLSFSRSGELLFQMGEANREQWPVDWLRSSGETETIIAEPARYSWPRISPDGNRIALTRGPDATSEVIVYDTQNDTTTVLSQPGEVDTVPVWSPDGRHIVMQQISDIGSADLVWKRADGSGETVMLLDRDYPLLPYSISPDGKYLAFCEITPETRFDIWVAPLDLSDPDQPVLGDPEALLRSPGVDTAPDFSPDGKWIAYTSDDSGQFEIYVQPFPSLGARRKVSEDGGIGSLWSRKDQEILFEKISANGIFAVDYRIDGDAFIAGRTRQWSDTPLNRSGTQAHLDLHPDGERVLMFPMPEPSDEEVEARFAYLLNFFDELRRRVPAGGN